MISPFVTICVRLPAILDSALDIAYAAIATVEVDQRRTALIRSGSENVTYHDAVVASVVDMPDRAVDEGKRVPENRTAAGTVKRLDQVQPFHRLASAAGERFAEKALVVAQNIDRK